MMTSRDFCYWLQGALELCSPQGLTVDQLELVKLHLSLVFVHEIDPSFGKDKKKLMDLHSKKVFNVRCAFVDCEDDAEPGSTTCNQHVSVAQFVSPHSSFDHVRMTC